MDVERIQKINTLALDLLKQGLAGDREEAVVMAEKIFRNKDGGNATIRETMNEIQRSAAQTNNTLEPVSELTSESLKQIIEQNTKFIVGKFKEIQDKLSVMENEIAAIKGTMRPAAPQTNHPSIQPSNPQLRGSASALPSTAPSSAGSHPRSGSFSAADVSIEKFFYMGSK